MHLRLTAHNAASRTASFCFDRRSAENGNFSGTLKSSQSSLFFELGFTSIAEPKLSVPYLHQIFYFQRPGSGWLFSSVMGVGSYVRPMSVGICLRGCSGWSCCHVRFFRHRMMTWFIDFRLLILICNNTLSQIKNSYAIWQKCRFLISIYLRIKNDCVVKKRPFTVSSAIEIVGMLLLNNNGTFIWIIIHIFIELWLVTIPVTIIIKLRFFNYHNCIMNELLVIFDWKETS